MYTHTCSKLCPVVLWRHNVMFNSTTARAILLVRLNRPTQKWFILERRCHFHPTLFDFKWPFIISGLTLHSTNFCCLVCFCNHKLIITAYILSLAITISYHLFNKVWNHHISQFGLCVNYIFSVTKMLIQCMYIVYILDIYYNTPLVINSSYIDISR